MGDGKSGRVDMPRSTLGLSAVSLLSVAAATTGFGVLLDEGLWGPVALLVAAVVVAAAALTRTLLRRRSLPIRAIGGVGAAVTAGTVAVTALFARDTAILGVIPTPESLQRFVTLVAAGEQSIVEQSIPAMADDGISFVLACGVGLFAVLVDAAATTSRHPAMAGIPLLGMLAVPVILAPGSLPLLTVVATSAAYLLLLAVHRPASSRGRPATARAVLVAAAVLSAAIIVPPLLPPLPPGSALSGSTVAGLVTGINPVVELGNDLRRTTPVTALRYSTDAEGGLYLTLSHLADFEDDAVQPVPATELRDPVDLGRPSWLGTQVETTSISTRIELDGIRTRWVPLPSAPLGVDGLVGEWLVNADGVGLSTVDGSVRETVYWVDSLVASPTPEQLRNAEVNAAGLEQFRALPAQRDPVIARVAAEVVAPDASPYEQALALQRFFTGGQFEYSEQAPLEQGYDGTSADVVANFLERRSGYCVHFAAAMTLMARTVGIPARIAVGFLPGARNPDAPSEYIVSTNDLHAWPELHFDDIGWVRFEPTPSRGVTPDYATAGVEALDDLPVESGEPSDPDAAGDLIEPTAGPEAGGSDDDLVDRVTGPSDAPDALELLGPGGIDGAIGPPTGGGADVRLAGVVVLVLAVLLFAPGLSRLVRRALRARTGEPLALWRELRDTAHDLGLPADSTLTPRQLAARWSPEWSDSEVRTLARIVATVESRVFAPPHSTLDTSTMLVSDVRATQQAMRRRVTVRRRLLAALAPASLLPQ